MNTIQETSSELFYNESKPSVKQGAVVSFGMVLGMLAIVWIFSGAGAFAQGVGISETAIVADASSVLELRSALRGFLLPRMTTTQRDAITSPKAGLLVYNTDNNTFNFYSGSAWITILNNTNGVNAVTGTPGRIVIGGTSTNPTVDIDATYGGQSSITTLGTITTGTWNGTTLAIGNGGTGATSVVGARTNLVLENVDNTSDVNKPVSNDQQAALDLKENTANKTSDINLGTSDALFPTQKAVKTYVDAASSTSSAGLTAEQIRAIGVENAISLRVNTDSSNLKLELVRAKGIEQDLSLRVHADSLALQTEVVRAIAAESTKENTTNKSTDVNLGASDALFPTQKAVKTYVDVASGTSNAGLNAEKARAIAVENDLSLRLNTDSSNLKVEVVRAKGIEQDLSIRVHADSLALQTEMVRAIAEETTKENTSNKSTDVSLGTSDALFPTQKAVKTYVDVASSTSSAGLNAEKARAIAVENNLSLRVNADSSNLKLEVTRSKGIEQDLSLRVHADSLALQTEIVRAIAAETTKENTSNKSTDVNLGTSDALFPTQKAVKTYVDAASSTSSAGLNLEKVRAIGVENAISSRVNTDSLNLKLEVTRSEGIEQDLSLRVHADSLALETEILRAGAAESTKENTSNKSTDVNLGTSDALFPTQNAVRTYVDAAILVATPDATTLVKGKVQLAGDLAGTAASPSVVSIGGQTASAVATGSVLANAATATNTVNTIVKRDGSGDFLAHNITANNITADITGNISGTSSNVTGIIAIANGGTGANSVAGAKTNLGIGNVDNTSDLLKPISTATQAALDLKAPLVSPILTTPNLGVATATSINGNTITAGTGILTIAAGKTLNATGDATISGINTGDQTTITGNAGTATKLATAVNINSVPFDGSGSIIVAAAAGTLTGTILNSSIVTSSLTSVGTLTNLTVTNTISGSVTGTSSDVTGIIGIAHGGTGQTTSQGALNTLAGAQTTGQYLRGDGTDVKMSAIQAGDVPVLNQSTTGNASTATKLTTSRKINTVNFDGTSDITVTADASTLTGSILSTGILNSSLISVGTITTGIWNGTTIDIAHGGTGQTSRQGALNALAGGVTNAKFLRGDGLNIALASVVATEVANTAAGNVISTNVQDAINELDNEKAPKASPTFTGTVTIGASGSPIQSIIFKQVTTSTLNVVSKTNTSQTYSVPGAIAGATVIVNPVLPISSTTVFIGYAMVSATDTVEVGWNTAFGISQTLSSGQVLNITVINH